MGICVGPTTASRGEKIAKIAGTDLAKSDIYALGNNGRLYLSTTGKNFRIADKQLPEINIVNIFSSPDSVLLLTDKNDIVSAVTGRRNVFGASADAAELGNKLYGGTELFADVQAGHYETLITFADGSALSTFSCLQGSGVELKETLSDHKGVECINNMGFFIESSLLSGSRGEKLKKIVQYDCYLFFAIFENSKELLVIDVCGEIERKMLPSKATDLQVFTNEGPVVFMENGVSCYLVSTINKSMTKVLKNPVQTPLKKAIMADIYGSALSLVTPRGEFEACIWKSVIRSDGTHCYLSSSLTLPAIPKQIMGRSKDDIARGCVLFDDGTVLTIGEQFN